MDLRNHHGGNDLVVQTVKGQTSHNHHYYSHNMVVHVGALLCCLFLRNSAHLNESQTLESLEVFILESQMSKYKLLERHWTTLILHHPLPFRF